MVHLNHQRIRSCLALFIVKAIYFLLIPWNSFLLHVVVPLTKLVWWTRAVLFPGLSNIKSRNITSFSNREIFFLLFICCIILFGGHLSICMIFCNSKNYFKDHISEGFTICFHLKDKSNLTWSFIMKKPLHVITLVIENWNEVRGS